MKTYPADEKQISDVERGRSSEAIVSLSPGESLKAGDNVLFALSLSRGGQLPSYVKGGDSVLVCLTDVTDLGLTDPASDHALVQLTWKPPGQGDPPASIAKRAARLGPRERP